MRLAISLVLGGGVLFSVILVSRSHWLRRARASGDVVRPEAPAIVRILRSEDELREAAHRASQFDRAAAEVLRARADHYEKLVPLASVTDIKESCKRPGPIRSGRSVPAKGMSSSVS